MLGPSLRPFPGCVRACARLCTLAGLSLAGGRASAATQHNSPPAAATYLPCCGRRTFVLLLASLEERPPPPSAVRCAVGGPGPANLAAGRELGPGAGRSFSLAEGGFELPPGAPRVRGRRGGEGGSGKAGTARGGQAGSSQAPRALASLPREAGVRQGPHLQAGRHH